MSDSDDDLRPVYRSAMAPPPPSRQPSSDGAALFGLCAEHPLNLIPPNPTPGGGPWWGLAGSASSTQPITPPDSADAPSLSRTFFPPLPVAASNDMIWHMGSDAPPMLRPTRARTTPPRIPSPRKSPPREEVTDADVDGLANEWARMKVQSEEIRSNLATSMQTMQQLAASNEGILQELRSGDIGRGSVRAASPVAADEPLESLFVAPRRDASESTVMVVMSDHSDNEGEEEGGQEGGAIVVQRVDSDSEDDDEDDPPQNVYRGIDSPVFRPGRSASLASASSCAQSDSSTSASPTMRGTHGYAGVPRWPTAHDASVAPGKRSRSITSQLAAQPLHPSKQRSQPSSVRTTSPLPEARAEAEMKRIEELKALIASEKAELARLIEAYKENEIALAQVREMNKSLLEEVARVRQAASARQAQEASG